MADLLRISLLGTLPSGEKWSVNPVFRIGGACTFEQAQAVATGAANVAIGTGITQSWNTETRFTGARVEARNYDDTLEAQAEATRGAPVVGIGTTNHPGQVAWVISLITNAPGPSGKGRMYLPGTGALLSSTSLRPSSTIVGQFVSSARTMLVDLNGVVRTTFPGAVGLSVWSRKGNSSAVVTKVRCGDVLDTQRRRRDTLIEAYTTLGFPT